MFAVTLLLSCSSCTAVTHQLNSLHTPPNNNQQPKQKLRLLTGPQGVPLTATMEDTPLIVSLWRSDAVAGVVELNARTLAVTRADDAAGLMFGAGSKALLRRDFRV